MRAGGEVLEVLGCLGTQFQVERQHAVIFVS